MTQQLAEPDSALVERILSEVSFQQRLVGYRFRWRAGALPTSMYRFEEVVHLLNDKCPRLNLTKLQSWIREVMEDEELAKRIGEAIAEEEHDRARILRARALMGERLCQCKKTEPSS